MRTALIQSYDDDDELINETVMVVPVVYDDADEDLGTPIFGPDGEILSFPMATYRPHVGFRHPKEN